MHFTYRINNFYLPSLTVSTSISCVKRIVLFSCRVTSITAEELLAADAQEKIEKLTKAQLQIVILCPILATKLADLKRDVNGETLFKQDKVLVMLLGVEKNSIISSNCEGTIMALDFYLYVFCKAMTLMFFIQ